MLDCLSSFWIAASSSSSVAVLSTNCTGDEFHLQGCDSFQLLHSNTCDSQQTINLGCVGKFSRVYVL